MNRSIRRRCGVVLVLCLLICVAWMMPASAQAASVSVTPTSQPVWNVVDFNVVSANVGTAASGYAEFFKLTGEQILTPPFYKNYPGVGAGPSGQPHPPPYDKDLSNGLASLGLVDRSSFTAADFSNGKGVLLSFMVIADGSVTGSSPDFTSGPIIPNSLFPIHFTGQTLHNGQPFSDASNFDVPAQTTLDPAFANVEGASHFPLFFFDNADFANDKNAPLAGDYEYRLSLTDAAGNGYSLVAPFTITGGGGPSPIPLPAAVWAGAPLLAGLPMIKRLRRMWR